jgi:hypothetical protein
MDEYCKGTSRVPGQRSGIMITEEVIMTGKNIWSRIVFTSVLAGGILLAVGGTVRADERSDCSRRLEADRARIDRDASKHGEHSRQVDNDVARMDGDRQWCRDHKADWDHSRFDIGIYFRK